MTSQCRCSASKLSLIVAPTDSSPTPYRPPAVVRMGGDSRHADLEAGIGERPVLRAGLHQPVARSLNRDRLVAPQQVHQHLEILFERSALVERIDADHGRVRRQGAWPNAHHHPASGQVVEQHHAVGDPQRVVVGQRDHARAQLDVPRLGRHVGDEDLGRWNQLHSAGVVFANPGFVVAELVEELNGRQSRAYAAVGFCPVGAWKGAIKMPKRIRVMLISHLCSLHREAAVGE